MAQGCISSIGCYADEGDNESADEGDNESVAMPIRVNIAASVAHIYCQSVLLPLSHYMFN